MSSYFLGYPNMLIICQFNNVFYILASTPDSKSFTIPNPCDKLSEEVKSKVNAARTRGERMFRYHPYIT